MKYARFGFVVVVASVLVGCGAASDDWVTVKLNQQVVDQCMRSELFAACMKSLPAGPQTTRYNDWDEVVNACEGAAYYQSMRSTESVKPECRAI